MNIFERVLTGVVFIFIMPICIMQFNFISYFCLLIRLLVFGQIIISILIRICFMTTVLSLNLSLSYLIEQYHFDSFSFI